ncbi:FAD/NAD(P)-binding domain-containing protein [Pluteus cervinus]|uniref:FAD/NAD(P)-binding domain-containing protein n=1 Tax=Pluteus cervinus TaxID=181527 RepID=A0ACD3AQY0_9AGAR|nr:FAD/NAD(P)-binding domain-containing protein [Pluteus cervinus]
MKVAVIGSGVSGLGATWLLNEHSDHEVHLYECDDRPGGHANTVRFVPPGKPEKDGVDVDTGFIVLNPTTYPNFLRFLKLYPRTIKILPTEMTFSITRDGGAFEWAGKDLFTVFCQGWRRVVDPGMWRMIYDVLRFNACSREILVYERLKAGKDMSVGDYLAREGYSEEFTHNYLIPMTAAIWSTPPDKCALDFPAHTLIQFMHNHHLLQVTGKPKWLTLHGGSRTYVRQIHSALPPSQLHLSTPIVSLTTFTPPPQKKATRQGKAPSPPPEPKVKIMSASGVEEIFDHVVLACHSDTALKILRAGSQKAGLAASGEQGITQEEENILSMFSWTQNEAVLHADVNLMPKSRPAWSCWNYLTKTSDQVDKKGKRKLNVNEVSLTYGMNDLQHIPESKYGPVLVTLNPPLDMQPDPSLTTGRWKYEHPVLDAKAVHAQTQMFKIQNKRSISFAGAWLRYGFHEDGFSSGIQAALALSESAASLGNDERIIPPFPIVIAYTDPTFTYPQLLLYYFFRLFEVTRTRPLVGFMLRPFLVLLGVLTGANRG